MLARVAAAISREPITSNRQSCIIRRKVQHVTSREFITNWIQEGQIADSLGQEQRNNNIVTIELRWTELFGSIIDTSVYTLYWRQVHTPIELQEDNLPSEKLTPIPEKPFVRFSGSVNLNTNSWMKVQN